LRFNAYGPDGLLDGKAPGQPSILSEAHRQHLVQMIEDGPIPAVHGVVRWRLIDLALGGGPDHHLPADAEPGGARP
jgi:hypothetical protein